MVAKKTTRKSSKKAMPAAIPAGSMEDTIKSALGGPSPDEMTPEPGVKRDGDKAEISDGRRKEVQRWQDDIRADKKYYAKVWKRMYEDMEYAKLGAKKEWVDGENYTVPIINRFINQATSALYAKNPKAVAKRKPKLLYTVWDGTAETAKAALMTMQQFSQMPPQVDPLTGQLGAPPPEAANAQQILQEIQQSKQYNMLMDRAGRTLEILFQHFTGMDFPDFKKQMKGCVRRAKTTAVGYCEVSFHRATEADPDITQRIGDMTAQIEFIKSKQADLKDGKLEGKPDEIEELESTIKTMEQEKMKITVEGLVYDFVRSTDIIPSKKCTAISGFIGAPYITREYQMDKAEIQETFKVDVGDSYKVYTDGKSSTGDAGGAGNAQEGDRNEDTSDNVGVSGKGGKPDDKGKACVWRVFNKKTRQVLWLCEGYPDFLKEPAPIEFQVHGFWPVFPLIFNEVEDEKEIFPYSDVHYLKSMQNEFNSARQGLREHRRANRPKYFAKAGVLEEDEKRVIETAPAHAVIELKGIEGNMAIDQLIQPYKGVPIDPNLYETSSIVKDVLYSVGAQTADFGQTGDSTATESNIAESSHMSTLASNVNDLDEFLSEIARASAQIMLQQMNKESVVEIVGPGAVWPELDAETISKELYLEIKAGSSGRPNQAAELANLERGMQFLIQLGGINPTAIAKKYCQLLDIDEEELIEDGMPSIIALNAMATQAAQAKNQAILATHQASTDAAHGGPAAAGVPEAPAAPGAPQPGTGNAATNPAEQGQHGANNMQQPAGTAPQGQPAFPAPTHRYNAQGARIH